MLRSDIGRGITADCKSFNAHIGMAVYVLDCFFEICELTGIVAIRSVNIALPHLEVNVDFCDAGMCVWVK